MSYGRTQKGYVENRQGYSLSFYSLISKSIAVSKLFF